MTRTLLTWTVLFLSPLMLYAVEDATPRLDPESLQMQSETLTQAQRQKIYLGLIEDLIGWGEASGQFVDSEAIEPGGGYFEGKGHGVTWPRGNSNLCIGYALLLRSYPERGHFTMHRIPRAVLEAHLRKATRALCLSNKNLSQHRKSDFTWGGPSWQTALEFLGAAWGPVLYPAAFDDETLAWVHEITTKEADIFAKKEIPSGKVGNTRAEDCAWNTPFQAFAACRYGDHPNAARWNESCTEWALNTLSTAADAKSGEVVDGKPLSEWIVSENVYPDLTIENHGFWSVGYQCSPMLFGEAALAYRVFGKPTPEALGHRAEAMWKNVMSALYLWDGDILFPNGQDWNWKTYSHVEYLCWQATVQHNAEAGALESRALQMIRKRQLAVGTGDLGADNFGNQTTKVRRWSFSYLMHEYFKTSETATIADAAKVAEGAHIFPHTRTGIHRTPQKCVSVSWHPRSQAIYILPEGDSTFTAPPFFFPWDRWSGVCQIEVEPASQKNAATPNLIRADDAPEGGGMRVLFQTRWDDAVTQYIGVVSLPDEATVWCTLFHAERAAKVKLGRMFPLHAEAPPGFVRPVLQHRGERWLNMSDHIGFISPEPLPAEIADGEFFLRDAEERSVTQGEWFGRAALVAYARQDHAKTKALADAVQFMDAGPGEIALKLESSSGPHTVHVDFAGGR